MERPMTQKDSGKPAKKTGGPASGREKKKRNTRATRKAAEGHTPAAATTLKRAELYRKLYAQSLKGRDPQSLGAEHDLSPRRVSEILDELRAARIDLLKLDDPWRSHRFAEELLLWRLGVIDDAAVMQAEAEAAGNQSVALGALKLRVRALTELWELLAETGLLTKLSNLRGEADAGRLVDTILRVFAENGVPDEVGRAISDALEVDVRPRPEGGLELRAGTPHQGWTIGNAAGWPRPS
jgi:hypothetical protein